MDDYGSVVYLDVQKTGSTFISSFMRQHMALPLLMSRKHDRIERRNPEAYYFISAREPLSSYVSLYQYGCEGRGRFARSLKSAGHDGLYDGTQEGFADWLQFLLDPDNARYLPAVYRRGNPALVGLQSSRFLALSFVDAHSQMRGMTDRAELRHCYATERLQSYVVKTETLNDDLTDLFSTWLRHTLIDHGAAMRWLDAERRVNASPTLVDPERLPDHVKETVAQREWFLFETLYSHTALAEAA